MSSSSNQSKTITTNSNLHQDESKWVIHIQKTLERELEEETEINVSIFGVPKTLMVYDPECYVPQRVAIGPYHYTNPELHEMERHKLDAAKIFQRQLRTIKLHSLAEEMMKVESRIRLSYDRQLSLRTETLAWMMAVDASFLLEFLKVYAVKEGKLMAAMISSKMSHLVDLAGKKSSHNALLRDIIMLENQIPFFVLRKMLEPQCQSPEASDDLLLTMLMGLSKDLSPFKMADDSAVVPMAEATHLLGYLFESIVPEMEGEHVEIEIDGGGEVKEKKDGEEDEDLLKNSGYVKSAFTQVWAILSKLNRGPARALKRLSSLAPVKTVLLMPWNAITNLPGLNVMKGPIESMFSCGKNPEDDEKSDAKDNADKPPSIEEITIPSVTELANAGVRFVPTNKGILSVEFDTKTFTLYLPVVSLDINSEVVLRNLVAYEACIAKGPLVLARYTEFMNGIVDTEEDAKFLREKGIILNHLKSDSEVANLWNGMNKSVRLTKVAFLDKVIDNVNKYYNCRWNVKTKRFMKSYIFGSWQFLTFLATIVLLLLMVLQSFCSVYTCSRFFNQVTILGTNEQN
ncbi:putative UPF0481 protein At3g02645 [Ipomoea triloba]|uniref:putative UPF0481 protein At3g02645 n=1 Tax=Ipomoea triloba TaxID=35885 RepID=UPI00125D27F3|nr:putative UPF0481 protein At3g02645 [Ipomoea triloba]